MSSVVFRPNPAFETEFLSSPSIERFARVLAEAVAAAAEAKAPRRLGFLEAGIEANTWLDGERGQYVGVVFSTDWKTMLIEHGTRRMRARPFLMPALIETVPGARITGGGAG